MLKESWTDYVLHYSIAWVKLDAVWRTETDQIENNWINCILFNTPNK